MRPRVLAVLAGVLWIPVAQASAASFEIRDFKAEETQIHTREFKKVDLTAVVEVSPGAVAPQLNLVQVNEQGERLRFLGILIPYPKKGIWKRRVELLEREPGKLYFEIVPEEELEPFQKRPRPRAVIEVFKRPSLLEILKGVVGRFLNRFGGKDAGASEKQELDCSAFAETELKAVAAPGLPEGARGFAAPRLVQGSEEGGRALLSAVVPRPREGIHQLLWEPLNLKDPARTTLKVSAMASESKQVERKEVEVDARPIFFLSVKWTELWEHQGVRIRYRKVSGDSRLGHLCGWMEVVEVSPGVSKVTLYEEVKAMGRSAEDTLEGHIGTIRQILDSVK